MPEDAGKIPEKHGEYRKPGVLVRYGHRLYRATRLSSGNWLVVNSDGTDRRTITNAEFQGNYEKVPDEHDHQSR